MATPKKVDTKKGAPIVRMHDEDDADRIGNPASDEIDEDLRRPRRRILAWTRTKRSDRRAGQKERADPKEVASVPPGGL